ncbi:hypothetical protein MPU32_000027 [Escherichia coli]|nr:hypothetical protein [Escherichia coli]EKT0184590.1 hypothetical protein [Escherichia coli]MBW9319848.1 hypothetical protein [Escherichia coli]OJP54216.1 hypothetical protein BK341_05515 [Escherichia coli]HAJ4481457.1 hypothetical protein [Escherichia coli]
MHRIDTKTAQKDKFGAGKNGFTRGNPQTGTPATDLDDDYFDMLQEELCSVVEASGASLEKGRHDQLLTALRALLLSRKNPFGDIKSDGTVKTALENLSLSDSTGTVGRLINCQLFTSGGFYTPSPGMKFFLAHMIGGGGASGGTPATSSSQTGGVAAGNSGAYAYIKAYASDIGAGKAVSVGAGGKSQVNGAGFAGGTTAIADIADVTGGYGSGPGSVGATIAVAQPSYDKPVINKYNKTEVLAFSLGSQAWNFLQVATGSGTGWLSPASPFPGGERGRGGSGIFVNASSAAQAGLAGNDGAILIMEYA